MSELEVLSKLEVPGGTEVMGEQVGPHSSIKSVGINRAGALIYSSSSLLLCFVDASAGHE